MARLGLKPYTLQIKAKKEESIEKRVIVPGAVVSYRGSVRGINLLSGQGSATLDEQALNSSEALLEYHFAQAIHQLIDTVPPQIGYLLGNGESLNDNIYHLSALLRSHFRVSPVFIDSINPIPAELKVLLVMKPQLAFTNSQKLKIDQYVMQGGKVLWLIDRLYAEMDSLLSSRADFVAYDRNLNLDDLLFRYGIRINPDLVQDLQCDQLPLVVGNMGDQPQMQLVDWPYFPLLDPSAAHPISRNLNKILSQFPNSIDTVSTPLLRKTVLLSSSRHARVLSTPALVSFSSVESEDDLKSFQRSSVPVAVLVEGQFESLFRNRLSANQTDSLFQQSGHTFRPQSVPTQMIVVSDGDIATNTFTREGQPLEMGMNQFTRVQYANKDFLMNCLDFLIDPIGIFQSRAKEVTLRLLDPESVETYSLVAQLATLAGPLLVLLIVGLGIEAVRKKSFAARG
jgi:gliding-associated putative ABC transporter substrate-binding component GldG